MKKHSIFESSRFWAALSVLLIGEFLVLWLLHGDVRLWLATWLKMAKTGLPAILGTLAVLVISMLVSKSIATGLWRLSSAAGGWLQRTSFWFGRALSLFPIHAFAWSFIGLWIGRWGFPLWSLMPVTEPWTSLPWLDHLAREVWTWTPAVALLSLPLIGQWLVLLAQPSPEPEPTKLTPEEREASLATPHLDTPERVPGRPFEAFSLRTRNRIQLPDAAPTIRTHQPLSPAPNPIWNVGLLALILLFSIEDVLGLPGSMAKLVQALRGGQDHLSAAMPVLMLSCVAAIGTLCAGSPVFSAPTSFRHGLAWLFKALAWGVVLVCVWSVTMDARLPILPFVDSATVFTRPMAALWAGAPSMLCALSLWLLGHMISPSNEPLNHA
jgi:hypothetical protein